MLDLPPGKCQQGNADTNPVKTSPRYYRAKLNIIVKQTAVDFFGAHLSVGGFKKSDAEVLPENLHIQVTSAKFCPSHEVSHVMIMMFSRLGPDLNLNFPFFLSPAMSEM